MSGPLGSSQWMYSAGDKPAASVRFNAGDTAYLTRTSVTPTNTNIWTLSFWAKRTRTGIKDYYFYAGHSGTEKNNYLIFDDNDYINLNQRISNDDKHSYTNAKYRDPSSWYHVVYSWSSGTRKIYINGVQETFSSNVEISTAHSFNVSGRSTEIGRNTNYGGSATMYLDGYLAEVHFIDGTALTPTSFGESGDYGEWKPIEVEGLTYGDNGYYLDFKNSSALGADVSGNGNDWTVNNLTASDQMLDIPTNNFCTLNPLAAGYGVATHSEGNLKAVGHTGSGTWDTALGTFGISSGKWYFEVSGISYEHTQIGVLDSSVDYDTRNPQDSTGASVFYTSSGGEMRIDASMTTNDYGTFSSTDVMGIKLDADNKQISIYKNNSALVTDYALSTTFNVIFPFIVVFTSSATAVVNFGQDSSFAGSKTAQGNQDGNDIGDFYYTPPTNFLALCTSNLPTPAVTPSEHFNTVLYTGNNTANTAITGVGFQPDFLYIKSRSSAGSSNTYDAVRTVSAGGLTTNSYAAEYYTSNQLTSLDSDGFTLPADTAGYSNINNRTYAAWNWKANGSGSANTAGSINSTVSVNTDAGFSIVGYTGTSSTDNIGHGLSSAPEMIITKNRDYAGYQWSVYHKTLTVANRIYLNSNAAAIAGANDYGATEPSSTLFYVGGGGVEPNKSGDEYIGYCFHSVDGYSKVGSYIGNGDVDGTFAYTGFRPAFVMITCSSSASNGHWLIFDSVRQTYNVIGDVGLAADIADAEGLGSSWSPNTSGEVIDFLSNGFKIRTTATSGISVDGATHIYLAFAETPFKYANAR